MKRGSSGLSLVVGIDKPTGLSSHDVVNRCRRIFQERRCGHTGTLDPIATGVLPICIGPATRLDRYMTAHDKRYRVTIGFGFETTTDDVEGDPTVSSSVPSYIFDESFAATCVSSFRGKSMQVPPAFSAIKVNGKKAYEMARASKPVSLEPRPIEVYEADLVSVEQRGISGIPEWVVDFHVSKGTYIRSLARDLGRAIDCPAHVRSLRRTAAGRVGIEDCVSFETLETGGRSCAIDPVRMLGYRFAFGDNVQARVNAGNALETGQVALYDAIEADSADLMCACSAGISRSANDPVDAELACILVENKLKALYRYCSDSRIWKPDCVFSTGVSRGEC